MKLLIIINLTFACAILLIALLRARSGRAAARERALREAKLAATERADAAFARIACANTDDGLVVQNLQAKILWVNPAYCRIMGYAPEEVIGRNPMEYALLDSQKPSDDVIRNFSYNRDDPNWGRLSLYRNVRKNGEVFWNQIRVSYQQGEHGEDDYVILVCRDVSAEVDRENDLREKSAKLAHIAAHDTLTGVANRAQLMEFADKALAKAKETGTHVGVLQIDLDKFKAINDTYGHAGGDAVLKHIADHASRCLRKTDLLARLGGDEFVAICTYVDGLEALQRVGAGLVDAVRTPLTFDGQDISPSVSVGVALSEFGQDDLKTLLRHSDLALYEVKRNGRGHVALFEPQMKEQHSRRARRSDALQRAIDAGQLAFHFQPVVQLESGRVTGMEALVRWPHPTDGLLTPETILPLAENLGLMSAIDQQAFEAAVDLGAKMQDAGWNGIRTGFNASPEFLMKTELVDRLSTHAQRHKFAPENMVVELNEAFCFGNSGQINDRADIIDRLRHMGFELSLDGCNASFVGLMHLARLNIKRFKTDRALAANIDSDPSARAILSRIFDTATDLGLRVATVGIETHSQFEIVKGLSGDVAQGDWFAPPMPAEDVLDWLAEHGTPGRPVHLLHPQLPPPARIAI